MLDLSKHFIPWRWNPSKKEMDYWIEEKEEEFARQETRNLRLNPKKWKQRYLFSGLHEAFVAEFPTVLYQWLKRQAKIISIRLFQERIVWNQEVLNKLRSVDNCWYRTVEF